ncbi:MAG: hypothetical protein HOV81_40595 [Kofleriaceae bacterium]|nr:hypothetical protein [Kofleriaceae bacterium]
MSIDHCCNDAAKGLMRMVCALALFITACGGGSDDVVCGDRVCDPSETAGSCAEDCGCGNGVANPGEDCDGTDLGGGTCMDAVNRGGTLRCNSDCTFDVSACTLASCGNGVVEEGEACDGADLGSGTCSSIGYDGGAIACSADCAYDVTACCSDTCATAGTASCVGDSLRECAQAASGCLAWQVTDCAASNGICESTGATATCSCVDRCATVGDTRCEGAAIQTCAEVGGCLDWMSTTNCAAGTEICAVAPSGPVCAPDATAEDCADPYPLSPGDNIVAWTALDADYLTSQPSCNTTTFEGPDLVLSYTAPEDGFVRFTLNKAANTRHVFVVSSAACGTITPELACMSDYAPTSLSADLAVTMGVTYYFYVRDTNSGTAPLASPLLVTLDETLCSAIAPSVASLSPANGSSVPDLTPILTADLDYPLDPSAGLITITGDLGTSLTYDLATAPSAIAIVNDGKTLVIDPGIVFPAGENLTVSWSGLHDATCNALINPPTWAFQVTGPPCTPGVNGMVGNTLSRIPTGLSTAPTEYYVATDTAPNGYVYFGGTTQLYRTPKAGGTTQDIVSLATITSSHLGYDMLVDGDQIFTLDSSTTATSNVLWRLSSDAGATWPKQNYMQLPQTPNDDLRAITSYKGRYYLTTDESTDGTQIWSVAAASSALPQTAVLEATIPDEDYCDGIALDDNYYYLACYGDDRIIRVDRVTHVTELITVAYDVNITKNALHAHDFDGDGHADALYFSSYYEEVDYVCNPGGTGPFYTGVLASFGSGTSNYGLGFDPVNGVLWMFDDDTKELVKIE